MSTAIPQSDSEPPTLADGALDTLGCVFHIMGSESFALDTEESPGQFAARCAEIARHVENGAPAPSFGLVGGDGLRDWSIVRRFFVDRRRDEKNFVSNRLGSYRGIVEQFIVGLKSISTQNSETEHSVTRSMDLIEAAIAGGDLGNARDALERAVANIDDAFAQQKQRYEKQVSLLNERIDTLRDDLVATREDLQVDALTGIYNRGAFDEILQRRINTQFLMERPVSVVMIDIDHFKTVNDSFGHAAGDAVLKAVATCMLRSFIRKSDVLARFGGDEFAVILPDTNSVDSSTSIKRLLDSVRRIDVNHLAGIEDADRQHPVTLSVGCTALTESDTKETVLERADAAMYEAKAAGRDGYRIA